MQEFLWAMSLCSLNFSTFCSKSKIIPVLISRSPGINLPHFEKEKKNNILQFFLYYRESLSLKIYVFVLSTGKI